MAAADVDVVVVNWNTGDYLGECLRSVHETVPAPLLGKVVVVDNASTDDSLDRAQQWLRRPASVLVRNEVNRGFGAACNQGLALAGAVERLIGRGRREPSATALVRQARW